MVTAVFPKYFDILLMMTKYFRKHQRLHSSVIICLINASTLSKVPTLLMQQVHALLKNDVFNRLSASLVLLSNTITSLAATLHTYL